MSVFIIIAAFNEEKRLDGVLSQLKTNYRNIVVVDDGSTDRTFQIAEKNKIHVIKHVINRGQGAALKTGIDFALQQKADIIVTFDADGQFIVDDIKNMINPIMKKKFDIVLGSRFLGHAVNMPALKRFVLKIGVLVVFLLYGIRITDSQSGFRAMSSKAARKIKITADKMEHAGEIFHEIMRNKLKYKEIPITVIYDKYALTKGQPWGRSVDLGIKMILKRLMR